MTVKQIIDLLKQQGHKVDAYKRKDGGYLIKAIDGAKFSGAKGNEAARAMVNVSLSQRREKQLRSITPKAKTKAAKIRKAPKPPKAPLPEDLRKAIRRTQEKLRKEPTKIGGTITTKNIRHIFETQGKEQAMASLQKAQAYAAGIAYAENVQVFFTDFLGLYDVYNRPGTSGDANWSLRIPNNYEEVYCNNLREGKALNLPLILKLAIQARGNEFASQHQELINKLEGLI